MLAYGNLNASCNHTKLKISVVFFFFFRKGFKQHVPHFLRCLNCSLRNLSLDTGDILHFAVAASRWLIIMCGFVRLYMWRCDAIHGTEQSE